MNCAVIEANSAGLIVPWPGGASFPCPAMRGGVFAYQDANSGEEDLSVENGDRRTCSGVKMKEKWSLSIRKNCLFVSSLGLQKK